MEQIQQIIKVLNLNAYDRSPGLSFSEQRRIANSELIFFALLFLFVFNFFGLLRWFSLGIFAFLLPGLYTLR